MKSTLYLLSLLFISFSLLANKIDFEQSSKEEAIQIDEKTFPIIFEKFPITVSSNTP